MARAGGVVAPEVPAGSTTTPLVRARAGAGPPLPNLPRSETRSDQARQIISEGISTGTIAPDQLFSVQLLAQQLGVSRTPVREALLQLARQGIVQPVRNRGFRVVATSPEELHDIFEVRMWLEVPAARLACERATPADLKRIRAAYNEMVRSARANNDTRMWKHDKAFHFAVMSASGNRQAALYVDSLRDLVLRRGRLTLGSRSMVEIAEDHLPIVVALEGGMAADAAAAMGAHLARTASLLDVGAQLPAPA